jgi:hypothetical protein
VGAYFPKFNQEKSFQTHI